MRGPKAPIEQRQYQNITSVSDIDKNQIYVKANSWFVETFNSAESVVEFQDKDAGKIAGKYTFSYTEGMYTYRVKQTLNVDIKDGKIRISITEPYYQVTGDALSGIYSSPAAYRPLETQVGIDKARAEWIKLEQSLISYINKNDSW